MKKVYLTALLTMGLSISAFAVQRIPLDTHGNSLDPRYSGLSTCVIGTSTGTAAAGCAVGSGIILDVFPGTTTTEYVTFRDSATPNTSSAVLSIIPQPSALQGNHIYPRFKNGLSANMSATVGPSWTIVYSLDIK